MQSGPRIISREEFLEACEAVWTEIEYQNNLPRRTDDEAKDVPGFLTLMRCYLRKAEDEWADNPGVMQHDGQVQVESALNRLRSLAAIAVRAMIYNGFYHRSH